MKIISNRILAFVLSLSVCHCLFSNAFAVDISDVSDESSTVQLLLDTGMTQTEVNELDPDFQEFIANDLIESTNGAEIEYIDASLDNVVETTNIDNLSGISFSASAYKSGSTIYIYPTYEFTTYKLPVGGDYFSVSLGSAFSANSYGGTTWYKTTTMTSWKVNKQTLTPPIYSENYAIYSGSQLGNAEEQIYVKGCTSCKASAGEGSIKKISVTYVYNPKKYTVTPGFSLNSSIGGIEVSFSSSKTVYAASQIFTLSY